MIHQLSLKEIPFSLIKSGKKRIEMRLKTPKREAIGIGDTIEFLSEKDGEKIKVLVENIKFYPTFKELYEDNDKTLLGYSSNENASYEDMYLYYTEENILKYGVLAIFIKLI